MKKDDLLWIALAVAAGYYLAQRQPAPAADLSTQMVSAGKNQSPAFVPQTKPALAGHRCACRRQVIRRYSTV